MSIDFPTVVIGGGPAGCVAAALLARSGQQVLLVEQHRFPREKVCGECLSALGISVLGRIGALQPIRALHPARLTRAVLHSPSGSSIAMQLPEPMYGVSRSALDHQLLALARDAGAQLLQPARCETVEMPFVHVRDLVTNRVDAIRADRVLLCDGKGPVHANPASATSMGLQAHFENIPSSRDTVELFGINGGYGGVAPIEDDQWNVSFAVPVAKLRSKPGDIDRLFDEMTNVNRALRTRLAPARRTSRWHVAPLQKYPVARNWTANVIPIGNAACAIEPIGGEGMGLAMASAELAANAITSAAVSSASFDASALRRQYRRLWSARAPACAIAGLVISRPMLADAILGALAGCDLLVGTFARFAGKHPTAQTGA